jgi:hypothetical protein
VRVEEKTIERPSGDQAGFVSAAGSRVRRFRPDPSATTT